MALPQIQQARIIQAPGVFDYAMREGPNIAQAFTSGLNAGARIKEGKQAVKDREASRADRITERNQALLERFGADAVVDAESGLVDVQGSSNAARSRAELSALAAQAGEAEALGMTMDGIPPQAREMPEYKVGLARGLAKTRQEEMMLERIGAREDAIMKRQMEVNRLDNEAADKRRMEQDNAAFLRTLIGGKGGSSTAAPRPSIRVTEGPNGTSINRTFLNEDELRAFQQQEAARNAEQPTSGDPEMDAAVREAISQYDILQGRGKGADLEFDSKGLPKVTPSSFWDTASPEKIEALRRKVNPAKRPAVGVPLSELTR